jgi:nitroimidazol reductase NimA-like FMN-containing flavoprotein (pyridoxamine 5'-phosphate oxidase superfamily)
MLEIEDMTPRDMHALLQRVGYGHLGCTRAGRPYVVPIHYAYRHPDIYLFTTEGQKTDFISDNPEVCLQVEEVQDTTHWKSVIANGRAELLRQPEDVGQARDLILETNPTLTPAINRTWLDVWGRANVTAIYRIRPTHLSGRQTI